MKIFEITEAPNARLKRFADVTVDRLKKGSNQPGIPGAMAGGTKPASAVPQDIKDRTMVNPAGADNPRADIRQGRGFKVGTTTNSAGQTVTRDKYGNTTTTGADTVTTDKQGRITRVGFDSGKTPALPSNTKFYQSTDVDPRTGAEKTRTGVKLKTGGADYDVSFPGAYGTADASNPRLGVKGKIGSGKYAAQVDKDSVSLDYKVGGVGSKVTYNKDGSGSASVTQGDTTRTITSKKGGPLQGTVTRKKT